MQTDLHSSSGRTAAAPLSASIKPLYVGCATGFSGDRTDGAGPVVDTLIALGGGVLNFETLAERTLALAQVEKRKNPAMGYEPLLDDLVGPVLKRCLDHKIQIVSNFGAANPQACAQRIFALARAQGLRTPRIAVVHGLAARIAGRCAGGVCPPRDAPWAGTP